jgi:hypothetical protein
MVISAAVALALSGAVYAKGGSHGARTGASADAYIDKSATISAADCHGLSVESAKAACLRSAQSDSSAGANVGATTGSGSGASAGGSSEHGLSMERGMPAGSSESKPESSASGSESAR